MSLSLDGIRGMLEEYEADYHTGMDMNVIAGLLYDYTSGYPFLVSRLCQLLEQDVSSVYGDRKKAWTVSGVDEAVKLLLVEKNTLFDSIMGKLMDYTDMKQSLRRVLMEGERLTFNMDNDEIEQMMMYGFIKNENGILKISNRIFETRLYNLFLSDEEMKNDSMFKEGNLAKNKFVVDGQLNMRLVLENFIKTYTEIFGSLGEKFKEKDGREHFLLYLKPIIMVPATTILRHRQEMLNGQM